MFRIQELRTAKKLTQKALAEKIGVKNYTVANWEQGRTEPSVKDLIDLANFFECSLDYLVGRENEFGQIIVFERESKKHQELFSLYDGLPDEKKQLIISLLRELR